MLQLYICHTSAYTKHMHTPGALNIPDMFHISICSGEKEHENRIDI
ncbi:toxin-antitoxin system, antitoxin component, AbrB family protein (plasmid) [Escherichia coli]|nr:toxin-antitoxin system, antitoxin component, AbrB family protein [Escherichia coli]RLO14421.1 toxin-antitoxin system, antitoxin component, AbrB family protein [Klebsiella pneumoniae]OTB69151.1 toxin-antitoxin system, antitoxin component, AbrB family protein [Escherichia coli]TJE63903.1 toxin-antitoxin system, antitoxin component, AbrB family protein [Escherichia coli]TJE69952.1 toxin-antitoxin system, antitoxin component, AbrB family protein [Escherichia coli]